MKEPHLLPSLDHVSDCRRAKASPGIWGYVWNGLAGHHVLSSAKSLSSALFAGFLGLAGFIPAALAQSPACNQIQAQIASLSRGDPGKAAGFARAAQKQRGELDRTSAYAGSIGCSNRKFLFFGSSPPAQCGQIESQMQRMQANYQNLQAQADAAGGGDERAIRDLTARYNNQCRAASVAPPRPPGLFEELFGGNQPPQTPQRYERIPLDPPPEPDLPGDGEFEAPRRGGSKAVCVRTCDGAFFPVSYSARASSLDGLGDLCHALCPNAEAKLYTMPGGGEIEQAVSPDGDAYGDLPNALKFQKSYDAACSCKARGQSWVEALAEAERVLGTTSRNDIVVTPQKSDELARPNIAGVTLRPKTPAKGKVPPPPPLVDEMALDAAKAAKVPAPGTDPSGIGADPAIAQQTNADPQFREVTGKDGIKRRVRIVGPQQ